MLRFVWCRGRDHSNLSKPSGQFIIQSDGSVFLFVIFFSESDVGRDREGRECVNKSKNFKLPILSGFSLTANFRSKGKISICLALKVGFHVLIQV